MKKSVILGLLGLAIGTVSSFGQGNVYLDNYFSSTYNPVVYSAGLGGGLVPSSAGFTVQIWYTTTQNQDNTTVANAAEAADSSGAALLSTFGSFVAATGAGSTASIYSAVPGYFSAGPSFNIQPLAATSPVQSSYTIILAAFNGADYASSTIRGYSLAKYIQDANPSIAGGADLGTFWASSTPLITVYTVAPVPEPTTFALAGLGGASLLALRRKRA